LPVSLSVFPPFLEKKLAEMLRQPRMMLTLILGPFLILFLFGIGYRDTARDVRTIFVAAEDNELRQNIEEFATTIGPQLIFEGITSDAQDAINRLSTGEVDMVVVPPANVDELIRQNEQAVFSIYHNEIDPAQVSYIEYLGRNYIDEVNRRVVGQLAAQAQEDTMELTPQIQNARQGRSQHAPGIRIGQCAGGTVASAEFESKYGWCAWVVGVAHAVCPGCARRNGE
jgi:ABC-2 type transport system permease protein